MTKVRRAAVGLGAAALAFSGGLLAVAFVPTLFGYEALVVTGGSMGKAVPVGSVALTRMVDVRAIGVGDVVSFRFPPSRETTTHRVVAISSETGGMVLQTRGDANRSVDPTPLPVASSIHRVEHVVPIAGRLVRRARTPLGAFLLFVLPVAGLAFERNRSRLRRMLGCRRSAVDLDTAGWSVSTMMLAAGGPAAPTAAARSNPRAGRAAKALPRAG